MGQMLLEARVAPRNTPQTRRAYLIASGLLAGWSVLARSAVAQELPKIRVMVVPADSFALAYYAQEAGLFARAGLDVEIIPRMNGAADIPAVIGGSADIAVAPPTLIANAVSRGVPLAIVSGAGMYTASAATTVLCVAKASSIRSAKELDGKDHWRRGYLRCL